MPIARSERGIKAIKLFKTLDFCLKKVTINKFKLINNFFINKRPRTERIAMGANKTKDARKSYPTVTAQNRNKGMTNKMKNTSVTCDESAPKNNNMIENQPNVEPHSSK